VKKSSLQASERQGEEVRGWGGRTYEEGG